MYRNNDFIYEATTQLEQLTGLKIELESSRRSYDAILTIKEKQFIVETKSALRNSNQGLIISQLEENKIQNRRPVILIAQYISKTGATELRNRQINYIDISGNAYIKYEDLFIFIEGQKRRTAELTNQSRAFQEAGIKTIFHLLQKPENLQQSYREIAENAKVSVGSVSNVMVELEELKFLIKTKNKRILKNKSELLERWLVAYNDVLRPRIVRNKMRFANSENYVKWKDFNLKEFKGDILWGGEPAGAILTDYLRPEKFTIFSNYDLPTIARLLNLVPDPNGNVELMQKFWKSEETNTEVAPALLVYTDLINSGFSRNIETAKLILEHELQHIK